MTAMRAYRATRSMTLGKSSDGLRCYPTPKRELESLTEESHSQQEDDIPNTFRNEETATIKREK